MSTVEHIRCSELDSLHSCTPSVLENGTGQIRISPHNDAAMLGSLVHELAQDWVDHADYNLAGKINTNGMDENQRDEAAKLMGYVTRSWDELNTYFPSAMLEKPVESDTIEADDGNQFKLTGTCDIVSNIGTTDAIFLDWKTGYIDDGYHNQMFGYAYSIWCTLGRPPATAITGVVVFLRHRYYRVVKYNSTSLSQWESNLMRNVLTARNTYSPGKQCTRCDFYASCPARKQVVVNMIDTLLPKTAGSEKTEYDEFMDEAKELLSGLNQTNKGNKAVGETIELLASRIRMAQQQIDETKGVIKEALKRVGPIELPGNVLLQMKKVEVNKLRPERAMALLRKKLSDNDICKAMRLSMPTIMNMYGKKWAPKERTAARSALFDDLKAANAIKVDVQHRLEETDISKVEMTTKEQNNGNTRGDDPDNGGGDEGESKLA